MPPNPVPQGHHHAANRYYPPPVNAVPLGSSRRPQTPAHTQSWAPGATNPPFSRPPNGSGRLPAESTNLSGTSRLHGSSQQREIPSGHENTRNRVSPAQVHGRTQRPQAHGSNERHHHQRQTPHYHPSLAGHVNDTRPSTDRRIILDDDDPEIALHRFLTNKTMVWDLRNMPFTAKDYSDSFWGVEIPFHHPSGIPDRIRLATISFVNDDFQWLHRQWGSVIVENRFGKITLGDIFSAIAMYFGEPLKNRECISLVDTPERRKRIGRAWDARHARDLNKRIHDDRETFTCRRIDLVSGCLKFHRLTIKWMGWDQCHLALALRREY